MDFVSPMHHGSAHVVGTFTEAVPSATNSTVAGTICGKFGDIDNKTDALEAVKLDPAVLEAQVTVETRSNAPEFNHNNTPTVEREQEPAASSPSEGFADMVMQHEAALLSLTPNQLGLLMHFADHLRRQRMATRKHKECGFCKNNGKTMYWYTSHALKDGRGRVLCPVLRAFRCPRCGATGDRAHTIKYCPEPADTESTWNGS